MAALGITTNARLALVGGRSGGWARPAVYRAGRPARIPAGSPPADPRPAPNADQAGWRLMCFGSPT
jgi:hypothetical protein